MKIRPNINERNTCNMVRYNPNTKGTSLLILDGVEKEEKKDYSNIVLLSLMHERGFLKRTFEETVNAAESYTEEYKRNDVMGL